MAGKRSAARGSSNAEPPKKHAAEGAAVDGAPMEDGEGESSAGQLGDEEFKRKMLEAVCAIPNLVTSMESLRTEFSTTVNTMKESMSSISTQVKAGAEKMEKIEKKVTYLDEKVEKQENLEL